MAVEEWAKDMVVTEATRAWPEGVLVTEMQDKTGIGTTQLRETLEAVEEEGILTREGGKVYLARTEEAQPPPEPRPVADPPPEEDRAPEVVVDSLPEEDVVDAEVQEDEGATPRRRYRGRFLVEVMFDAPADDAVARETLGAIREYAVDGVRGAAKGIATRSELVSLEEVAARPVEL